MIYTVYKTTNLINKKYYIGVHKTSNPNDGYMGSGHLILKAIAKYGKENFSKEILFMSESKKEAYEVEKNLVEVNEKTYNMAPGGIGGVGHLGSFRGRKHSEMSKEKMRKSAEGKHAGPLNGNYGRDFSAETRKKMSDKKVKSWIVIYPNGKTEQVMNLRKFSLDHNLDPSTLHSVAIGARKQHKGFRAMAQGGVLSR